MTTSTPLADPVLVLTGNVKSYEASGGGSASNLFSFYVTNGKDDASFQLRGDTPCGMFAAMATIVAAAYARPKTQIQVTSCDRLSNGYYLVNLIRGA